MAMGEDDRRAHERHEYTAQVSLRRHDDVTVLPVRNISAGGIYLALGIAQIPGVALGDAVSVHFDAGVDEHGEAMSIDMDAEVVRVDMRRLDREAGIALMWTSIDPLMVQRLAQVLAYLQK